MTSSLERHELAWRARAAQLEVELTRRDLSATQRSQLLDNLTVVREHLIRLREVLEASEKRS